MSSKPPTGCRSRCEEQALQCLDSSRWLEDAVKLKVRSVRKSYRTLILFCIFFLSLKDRDWRAVHIEDWSFPTICSNSSFADITPYPHPNIGIRHATPPDLTRIPNRGTRGVPCVANRKPTHNMPGWESLTMRTYCLEESSQCVRWCTCT